MRQPKIARTTVWYLRTPRSRMRCVLQPGSEGVELLVLHDEDVALRDMFPGLPDACRQADALRERLVARGWEQVFG